MTDRIARLRRFVDTDASDTFSLYALAMEYAAASQSDRAVACFEKLLTIAPDHVAGYQQLAALLARLGRYDQARRVLSAGAPRANAAGQFHARDKMNELLAELPSGNNHNKQATGGGRSDGFSDSPHLEQD